MDLYSSPYCGPLSRDWGQRSTQIQSLQGSSLDGQTFSVTVSMLQFTHLCLSCQRRAGHHLLSFSPHKGICPGSWCFTNLLWNARRHFSSPPHLSLLCLSYCISSIRLNRAVLDRILRLFSEVREVLRDFHFSLLFKMKRFFHNQIIELYKIFFQYLVYV